MAPQLTPFSFPVLQRVLVVVQAGDRTLMVLSKYVSSNGDKH